MLRKIILGFAAICGAIVIFFIRSPLTAQAAGSDCLTCHSQDITISFPNGDTVSAKINAAEYDMSAHAGFECAVCHTAITGYPHAKITANSALEFSAILKDACKTCHSAIYTKLSTTSHAAIWPIQVLCTDCHNPHIANSTQASIVEKSRICESCHSDVSQSYLTSIHGKAITEGLTGLPYCIDCHNGDHQFNIMPARAEVVSKCTRCHDNKTLMGTYGVSTTVISSYLHDFHGTTAVLQADQGSYVSAAICTDCHGVHTIQPADAANILSTPQGEVSVCQQCHPKAKPYFASAWLSHVTPSITEAPLVFLADWFYRLMIPLVIVGLLVHIGFDLWSSRKHRRGHYDV